MSNSLVARGVRTCARPILSALSESDPGSLFRSIAKLGAGALLLGSAWMSPAIAGALGELPDSSIVCSAASEGKSAVPVLGMVQSYAECGPGTPSEPPAGEPFYNDALPMGGIFYGNHEFGMDTGNSPIATESARRFRATRSGNVTSVRYENRTLSDATITQRCDAEGSGSVWCQCEANGLDRFTCGYSLSNSYSVGNGGEIVIEVREDVNGSPASTALGRTRGVFIPLDNASTAFPVLPLVSPVYLEAGRTYHLVFTNQATPNCRLSGVNASSARSCDRNRGAIALNGVFFGKIAAGDSAGFGPFRGTSAANLYRYGTGESWRTDGDNLTWYELGYSDGVWTGDSYVAYRSRTTGSHTVQGDSVARQTFKVQDVDRVANGLWLNLGHTFNSSADGSPLAVTVKDGSGATLAIGSIAASSECRSASAGGGSLANQHCRYWGYTDLSTSVALNRGQQYSVELRAGRTAGFVVSTTFPMRRGAQSRKHWSEARGELSTDGGRSWRAWPQPYADRDLSVLFTLDGQPRQLR